MTHSFIGQQILVPHLGGIPPVADFTSDVLFGTIPFNVAFTDLSTNGPTSWDWDFGDGTAHSTAQNPTHQYTVAGLYTVTLTATNAGGSDTETKVGYISAYEQVTLTLQPAAAAGEDTQIYSNAAGVTLNYGATVTFAGGGAPPAFAGKIRGLIKFDLSSIPGNAIISSGVMSLYCSSELNATNRDVGAHRALTQWFEGVRDGLAPLAGQDGSTWNLRNANGAVAWAGGVGGGSGSDYAAVATDTQTITGPATTFNWNVATDIAAFVAGTATNYGWWMINPDEATNDSAKLFDSSDGVTPAQRPKLVVIYKTVTP